MVEGAAGCVGEAAATDARARGVTRARAWQETRCCGQSHRLSAVPTDDARHRRLRQGRRTHSRGGDLAVAGAARVCVLDLRRLLCGARAAGAHRVPAHRGAVLGARGVLRRGRPPHGRHRGTVRKQSGDQAVHGGGDSLPVLRVDAGRPLRLEPEHQGAIRRVQSRRHIILGRQGWRVRAEHVGAGRGPRQDLRHRRGGASALPRHYRDVQRSLYH
mmetsp:Transcript_19436/g.46192  ORF Transcript_19436/g.46192 Transcript_19436/m.46192 type:complete len:216 (-) Transcript_19436:196-843(-)